MYAQLQKLNKMFAFSKFSYYSLDIAKDYDNKGVDQTARMQRLVWAFVVCMQLNEIFRSTKAFFK